MHIKMLDAASERALLDLEVGHHSMVFGRRAYGGRLILCAGSVSGFLFNPRELHLRYIKIFSMRRVNTEKSKIYCPARQE